MNISNRRHPVDLRMIWREVSKNRWGYIFISPFFIIFFIFHLFPPLFGLFLSLLKWDLLTPMVFVGFSNYLRIFSDRLFWLSVGNVILFTIVEAVPEIVISFLLAFLLDTYIKKGRNIYLAALFSPSVTSSVAVALVFGAMFGTNYGIVNYLLSTVNIEPVRWMSEPFPLKVVLIVLLFWRWLGWNTVIYLAGLQTINREYYEAALVDGANRFQILFRITVPLMRPVFLYTIVLTTIATLQLFAEPRLLTNNFGGRNNTLLTPVMFIFQNGFENFRFGYASAAAYVLFILILSASIINLRLLRQND